MNFTEAGRLLNVTQPAVSKSIAALEAYTGTKLFTREGSKLALTGEGESLYRTVQLSFLALENAIDQVSRVPKQKNALTLSLSTSFVAHWLIPQMEEFRRAFPDVALNFQLTGGEPSGPMEPCDLGLRLDSKVAPTDRAVPLAPEWLVAVASPEYIRRNGMLDGLTTRSTHSLVTFASSRIPWREFLAQTNQTLDISMPEIQVPDYSVVIQTALNGRGVALGYVTSCGYLLREGLLVPALRRTLRTGKRYCIVYPADMGKRRLAEDVGSWIIERSNTILNAISQLLLQ
ncbi:LysR substrate-binding domain-containing protein [Mesorhizobium sp. M0296]